MPHVSTGAVLRDAIGRRRSPVAEQAVSFRLIGGLEDSRFLLADNVYMRRGCVALALVRIDPDVRQASGQSIAPLATLADRKLAVAAQKIGAG